jgi:NACHT domain
VDSILKSGLIPSFKKLQFLKSMSEDEFRDRVVRPFYILRNLEPGKDLCGPDEEGKDCYFFGSDTVRGRILYAIQTKKGDLRMSQAARDNVTNAATQMKTALETQIKDGVTKQAYWPDCVLLVASGTINAPAERYIADHVKDTRIVFLDGPRLIPQIDRLMPELWLGIDVKTLPYLKALRDDLIRQSDTIDISHLGIGADVGSPITDDTYVQLYLNRLNPAAEQMGGTKKTQLWEELPVQHVLRRKERLILMTGNAGAGKTTSLRRLALILVQEALASNEAKEIPVFLRALEIVHSNGRLVDTAAMAASKLSAESSHCFSLKELQDGNVAVLIDGYDEVASEIKRDALIERIREFHTSFPKCRLILTSRDYTFARQLPEKLRFLRYNISPINLKQTEKIVARLSRGKGLQPEIANEMLRRLDNVHGMELNPLLVTVFVATSDYSRQDIPANITELFKKFTEMMLGRWDTSKGLSQQYHAPLKDFLLCRIACQMHESRVTSWPLTKFRKHIEQELEERDHEGDVDVLLEEILDRSGLVTVQDDEIRFRHLLIQEFFAGRGISKPDFLHSVIHDSWWTKALVFHFGQNPENHQELQAVIQKLDVLTGKKLYQSAVSIGLALQACYLAKRHDKSSTIRWVVNSLAATKNELVADGHDGKSPPAMDAMFYYIYARDAVGSKLIRDVAEAIANGSTEDVGAPENDVRRFWCIVGLIEAGETELAEKHIKHFNPADRRLLMCIYMGCNYFAKIRVSSAEQKKAAERIADQIAPRIGDLKKQIFQELKGMLLEVRSGEVKAIDEEKSGDEVDDE